uniref:Uncharacterized protein n=1 Tax=Ditylenchus dipsaci TaxID=166011 RepID=A0A915DJ12_9BILA
MYSTPIYQHLHTAVHPALNVAWEIEILGCSYSSFLNPQAKGPMADCKPTFEDLMEFPKPTLTNLPL